MTLAPSARQFSVLAALAIAALAPRGAAAVDSPLQHRYLTGESVPAAAPGASAAAVQSARDIQAGPRRGESPDAYGHRAREVGLQLGMTPVEATQAGDFYRRRAAFSAPTRGGSMPGGRASAEQLARSKQRVGAQLHDPGWTSPTAAPSYLLLHTGERTPAGRSSSFPLLSAPTPHHVLAVPPSPVRSAPPAHKPAAPARPWLTAKSSQWANWAYRTAADYNRRGNAITEQSSGDSWSGWFQRKGLKLVGSAASIGGFLIDPQVPDRLAKSALGAVRGAMSAERRRLTKGTWKEILADEAVVASFALMPGANLGARMGMQEGKAIRGAIDRYKAHPSHWNMGNVGYESSGVVMDVAGLAAAGAPSLLRRGAVLAAGEAIELADAALIAREAELGETAVDGLASGVRRGERAAGAPARPAPGRDPEPVVNADGETHVHRDGPVTPRKFLVDGEAHPALAQALETNYQRIAELERQYDRLWEAGAGRERLDPIRQESWRLHDENAQVLQPQIPSLAKIFAVKLEPGTPFPHEVMEAAAANMGVPLEIADEAVQFGSENSILRVLGKKDGVYEGLMPNKTKLGREGKLPGTGDHLLNDGSAHMVSIARDINGGIILLVTGYADARRVKPITEGVLYELEAVADAAPLPPTRQVFHGPLAQNELMVPKVPFDRIKRVRAWKAGLDPADPRRVVFEYTEPLPVGANPDPAALLQRLKAGPYNNRKVVEIPADASAHEFRPQGL
jgi:hypothetical protein